MTAYKHAALMLQYAQDAAETDKPWERWEVRSTHVGWVQLRDNPLWFPDGEYRRKPKTISINGIEVPEPDREPLDAGTLYWIPKLSSTKDVVVFRWAWDGGIDHRNLERGLVHLTEEAAAQHAKALLSFTQKVVPNDPMEDSVGATDAAMNGPA